MKNFLLFFSLFCFTTVAKAQESGQMRKIEWQNTKKFSQTKLLHFSRAIYPNPQSLLPYYSENVDISEFRNEIRFRLSDTRFAVCSENEKELIKFPGKITEKIELSQKVFHARKKPVLQLSFLPFRRNPATGEIEKLVAFRLVAKKTAHSLAGKKSRNRLKYAENSVLSTGEWYKIRIEQDGIYRLRFDELEELGIENPENLRIFGALPGMIPIQNSAPQIDDLTETQVLFDDISVIFYAAGADKWEYDTENQMFKPETHLYSNAAYYFLTDDYPATTDNTVPDAQEPLPSPTVEVTDFIDFKCHETDSLNFLKSGSEWFGEEFDLQTSRTFKFLFPDISAERQGRVEVSLLARSFVMSSFLLQTASSSQNIPIFPVANSSTSPYATKKEKTFDFSPENQEVEINLTYNKPTASSKGWLDRIVVNAYRQLIVSEPQMKFTYIETSNDSQVAEFSITKTNQNQLFVWDITNPFQIQNIPLQGDGNTLKFKYSTDSIHHFIAFESGSFLRPATVGTDVGFVENQNLHGFQHSDFFIVSHPDFLAQANQLAELHRSIDNLKVEVVSTEQVYNEFSGGKPDAGAIRNFVRMFYERAGNDLALLPKYLLLFGDGSFDNKSIATEPQNNSNLIPTYQSNNSLSITGSFVSDDFFGLLDPDEGGASGLVDIGIGRFPVRNTAEAAAVVSKISQYMSPISFGEWRNTLAFLADDGDNNTHTRDADRMAQKVDTSYQNFNIQKVYLDAHVQQNSTAGESYPQVDEKIKRLISFGTLIFNYTGHGNELGLASELELDVNQIQSWTNINKLPLFMTATCEFSRFDDITRTSAGEYVLLNPNGGGIALFSTTRLVYSSPNFILNRNFYDYIFEDDALGDLYRLGDVMRLTKNSAGGSLNKRNFTLLGDPALKIAQPKHRVALENMQIDGENFELDNGKWFNSASKTKALPTMSALSRVKISGVILENQSQNVLNNFQGELWIKVFDKEKVTQTLSNDGDPPMNFLQRENLLYRGKASVNQGIFEFSFIVPRDIGYAKGTGRMSLYAASQQTDAAGFCEDFLVGGTSQNALNDNQGPEIEIFLNDENFVFGGITHPTPRLIVHLSDSSGINMVGTGLGHDIVAIIDNDLKHQIVLTDAYQADLDSYQSGKIEYPLEKISEGYHNLKLKAWDINNNSSEGYIEFIVAETSELFVKNIFNYPNPFTRQTWFYFEHNQPNTTLEIEIQIFTLSGKLIRTLRGYTNTQGTRSEPVHWNGLDDFGDKIGKGVYIYRLRVKAPSGNLFEKMQKLLILK